MASRLVVEPGQDEPCEILGFAHGAVEALRSLDEPSNPEKTMLPGRPGSGGLIAGDVCSAVGRSWLRGKLVVSFRRAGRHRARQLTDFSVAAACPARPREIVVTT
jgi:hypothetical protein